ncbi:MAG TPA: DUF6779 domain-containing protein [Mycobacterium sp.]|nr:DUF6779 domain-containing protein [Mycobacterium sp.]HUH67999.1 DUF6779 domain-containing protein [Mycobacterium sp.]
MTVLSRGARVRRGGRGPGWVLLTALLVLAIGASSALVFTNRVELLKLAVILALWATVAGAFVSALYRRQSDVDRSRVRDLKLVYDLQLDREISARREYELTVESQLRRELASELRAQAADDLAALRAELSALRTGLEILFDTDLAHRPALETLETEAPRAGAYSDWTRNGEGPPVDWVSSNRVTSVPEDNPPSRTDSRADETAIIDVPEEPLLPPRERVGLESDAGQEAPYFAQPEDASTAPQPEPEPRFEPLDRPPPPPSAPAGPPPAPEPQPQPEPQMQDWEPVVADGQWLPPGTPGSHWAGGDLPSTTPGETSGRRRRARHSGPDEPVDGSPVAPAPRRPHSESGRRARSRHSAEYVDHGVRNFAAMKEAPAAPPPPPEPAPRHRGADPLSDGLDGSGEGPQTGGQSVADLLARLQVQRSGGGRRLRREGREA